VALPAPPAKGRARNKISAIDAWYVLQKKAIDAWSQDLIDPRKRSRKDSVIINKSRENPDAPSKNTI